MQQREQPQEVAIERIIVSPLHEAEEVEANTKRGPWITLRDKARRRRWHLVFVVLPTLLAACYYGLVAADRFEAETRFVVRSPSTATTNQLANFVSGASIVRSADEAYIVQAYFRSRDAVRRLVSEHNLLDIMMRPEADVLWKYPSAFRPANEENLWRHFQRYLTIDYDSSTGITTLKVQALRPEDSRTIVEALLIHGEELINRMSDRAQTEAIRTADAEVERNRENARGALERITEFRRRNAIIDPGRASTSALEAITKLSLEISRAKAELAEIRTASPDSPQANALKTRIAAFDAQIHEERVSLAGADASLAPLIAEYERLVLEREFSERTFASAQVALDAARLSSERQRLFLDRISTPMIPDYPSYPSRWLNTLAIFVICSLLYSIGRRLAGDTRAHGER